MGELTSGHLCGSGLIRAASVFVTMWRGNAQESIFGERSNRDGTDRIPACYDAEIVDTAGLCFTSTPAPTGKLNDVTLPYGEMTKAS